MALLRHCFGVSIIPFDCWIYFIAHYFSALQYEKHKETLHIVQCIITILVHHSLFWCIFDFCTILVHFRSCLIFRQSNTPTGGIFEKKSTSFPGQKLPCHFQYRRGFRLIFDFCFTMQYTVVQLN